MIYINASRVVKTFGCCFAFLACVAFTISRVLSFVFDLASTLITKALERYHSFTGRIALENFAEDKALYTSVQKIQESLFPIMEKAVPVFLFLSIFLFVLGILCFIFAKQIALFLIAIKIWTTKENDELNNQTFLISELFKNLFSSKSRIVSLICIVVIVLTISILLVIKSQISKEEVVSDLTKNATAFVLETKENFQKTKKIQKIKLDTDTTIFDYKISTYFAAALKQEVDGCKKGTVWKIIPKAEGLFQKKLKMIYQVPRDSACLHLIPNFKNIGK